MSKSKGSIRLITKIISSSKEDFFARGKKVALLADQKKSIPKQKIISFEHAKEMHAFLTNAKLNLIAAIRKNPNSISGLAKVLGRSRAAVNKDIQLLESIGIVKSKYVTNPGHGKHKIIVVAAQHPITLQFQVAV